MLQGRIDQVGRKDSFPSDEGFLNSDEFMSMSHYQSDGGMEHADSFGSADLQVLNEGSELHCVARPRLSNKSMLRGLVERTEHYNKTVDQKVMTDSRIAFEDEQLKGRKTQDLLARELEHLAMSNQHIPTRGRGDSFGRLRSSDSSDSPTKAPMLNNHGSKTSSALNQSHVSSFSDSVEPLPGVMNAKGDELGGKPRVFSYMESESLNFQLPRRSTYSRLASDGDAADPPIRHHFDPSTAYNGTVVPDYRYSYKPQPTGPPYARLIPSIQTFAPQPFGHRYPKRPESSRPPPSQPKHLNHNYYDINLYGATQDERIAQRIEKTVRRTEAPPRF